MINLVLNDLRRPTGKVFRARLHFQGLILHLDGFISLALTGDTEQRYATFFGVICAVLLDNLGIEHYRICRSSSTLVEKSNNTFAYTDHIRRTPTHLSLCAINVSSKSCATCISSFVATSDFPARKMGSCMSSLTISLLLTEYSYCL